MARAGASESLDQPAGKAAKSTKTTAKTSGRAKKVVEAAPKPKPEPKPTRARKAAAPAPAAAKAPAKSRGKAATALAEPPPPPAVTNAVSVKVLTKLRRLLEEERETYLRQAEDLAAEAEALAAERGSGDTQFDEESGEGDTLNVERERDLALSASARAAVEEIDRALSRIESGTYGVCERCGNKITVARLEALPYAALCIECKSRAERPRR